MKTNYYPISPTPWSFNPDEFGVSGGPIRDAEGYQIASEVNRADGAVMTAGPELLDACKQFIDLIEKGFVVFDTSQDPNPDPAMRQLRFVKAISAAQLGIAKAEPS